MYNLSASLLCIKTGTRSNLQCITKRKHRLRFNPGFESIIWMRGEKMMQFIFFSLWLFTKLLCLLLAIQTKFVQNWTLLIDKTAKSRLIRIHQFWFLNDFKFYFLFIIITFTMIDVTAQMSSHLSLNHFLSLGFLKQKVSGFCEKFISPRDLFLSHGLF